jgi:hypothetical protein
MLSASPIFLEAIACSSIKWFSYLISLYFVSEAGDLCFN